MAEPFVEWISRHDFVLTLEPDSPTRGANTIDLAWASPALVRMGVMTEVVENLHTTTSDHQTLRSTIVLQGSPQATAKGRFRPDTTNPEEFERSLRGVLPRVEGALFPEPTLEQLDRLTEEITTAIFTALAASTKRATGTGTGQPWWNQSCREEAAAHRRARADLGLNNEMTAEAK
jgi:hypothetical protein